MELTFSNQVALVTGAGRGIGKAIAEHLAAEGLTVLCASQNPASCGAAADAINAAGGKAEAWPMDVSNPAAVETATKAILEKHGTVDILVNNAGITRDGLMVMMKQDAWDDVLSTNLTSAFLLGKALVRPMTKKRRGRIINITSVSGVMGNAGQANYSAAKAGMIGLTKSMAKEFAGRNVTVNAVAPGFITTDMTAELSDKIVDEVTKVIPLKRFGETADIATMVTYLASDQASYITGQVFSVDGGLAI